MCYYYHSAIQWVLLIKLICTHNVHKSHHINTASPISSPAINSMVAITGQLTKATDWCGVQFLIQVTDTILSKKSRLAPKPTQVRIQWGLGYLLRSVKHQSSPSSSKVMNEWKYVSTSSVCLNGIQRDFTCSLNNYKGHSWLTTFKYVPVSCINCPSTVLISYSLKMEAVHSSYTVTTIH